MTKQKSLLAALVLGALGACQAPSSDPDSPDSPDRDVLAITNARIFTAASDKAAFSPALGTLLVQDGKILDVGNIPVPSGTRVVDAGGQSLIPGLVVSHSHMGFKQLKSDALRGLTLNAASLFHLDNRIGSLERGKDADFVILSGPPLDFESLVTTYVSPGGQNLVGGYGAVVKLNGRLVRERAALSVSFGETALEAFEAFDEPTTRQGMIGLLRQAFIRVQNDAGGGEDERALAQVLAREIPLRVLANTPDDILTALRLAEELVSRSSSTRQQEAMRSRTPLPSTAQRSWSARASSALEAAALSKPSRIRPVLP